MSPEFWIFIVFLTCLILSIYLFKEPIINLIRTHQEEIDAIFEDLNDSLSIAKKNFEIEKNRFDSLETDFLKLNQNFAEILRVIQEDHSFRIREMEKHLKFKKESMLIRLQKQAVASLGKRAVRIITHFLISEDQKNLSKEQHHKIAESQLNKILNL